MSVHLLAKLALLAAACAPVLAQASLRAPLQAWLAQKESPSQYEDLFVPFRKALLLAKSTKCALVPNGGTDALLYDVVPAIEPLDDGMESFVQNAGALPPGGNDKLLNLAAAFRANGDSLEPLLPWLLLLQKRGGADVRVELCLFEAWGTDALDCNASKAAAERLKKLDEVPLSKFLFEAKAFPAGKTDTVKRLVDQLCAGKLDKGAPLGAFALARALVAGFEKDYELAMQLGDFGRAQKCLETMLLANPKDLAAQLMLEVCGGQVKGARFVDRYKEASPAERDAIDARLQHLGLGIVAPGVSVAAVAQAASDDALDFFRTDLAKRVKELDSPIKAAEQAHKKKTDKAQNLREEIVELERKIKKFERIVGMRREVRGWKEDIDERKAEIEKCEAEAKNEIDVKTRLEAQRNELQGKIDAVNRRRSEFKLQPTADDPMPRDPDPEPRAAAGQPREADPFQPPDAPRQPAAVAPPMVEFDEALPQAKELRAATADLELGRFEKARNAFRAVMKDAVARVPADVTTQRLIAVTRYRLAESLQKLGMQKALVTRNDIDAQVDLNEADREFARLTGDDFGTAREGSSLRAAALRMRLQINSTLYRAYRGLAEANSRDASHRTRRDAHAKTANQMLEQLKSSFATATLPDGRRIVDVARDEAAAAALAR